MFSHLPAASRFGKSCAYVLLLLMPGSFFVLPVLWFARFFRQALVARCAARPQANAARA